VDERQFDEFYAGAGSRLVGQLYAMTGDHAEAQDCVQEAFVKAWARRAHLDADGNPEAWVRTTAWRLSVSRWRRTTATVRAYVRRGVADDVPEPGSERADLVAALRRINAEQRQVLVLHYLCDLSVEQIATETDCPPSTVKTRLHRGRAALAALLAPTEHDQEVTYRG